LKLLEIGKDFDIKIRGYTKSPKYPCVKKLVLRRKTSKGRLKILKEKIIKLQQRYPSKNYYLMPIRYKGRKYWKFGRRESGLKGVPIYYSTTLGKFFVPSTYVKQKKKLVCSVIMYRFRDLGVRYSLLYTR
jgi:hypothetical protein